MATPEQQAREAIFVINPEKPDTAHVKGYDFEKGVDYSAILDSYLNSGFQATNMGLAIDEINRMIKWRLSDEPISPDELDEQMRDPEYRKTVRCTIFLGYTSNMISSGMREVIRYLCKNSMADCIVTSGGGVEEDFIKCLAPVYMGDFALDGVSLRRKGLNRIGNLLMPNENYVLFEEWINPILEQCYQEQIKDKFIWSPTSLIDRLGKEINNEESIYYWCHKNQIPVFCPGLTDGSIGDMISFFCFNHDDFILDIAQDAKRLAKVAMYAKHSGTIILGGGLVKHHIFNANLMRNGADYCVLVNTGNEFDGSDSGARLDEAKSWGKLRYNSNPVKLYTEATLVFPLLVAKTFATHWEPKTKQ